MSWRKRRLRSLAWPLHELRGALTAIQLGLSLEGAVRKDGLLLQVERARLALDDLDSRLERKRDERDKAELVDINALVLNSTRAWSQLAPCYGARLRASWRVGQVRVRGHAGRLAQALDNVIANALEHGGGDVLVESELVRNRIRIAVADAGEGVAPTARVREAPPRSKRGHGLAITRNAVREHGGQLLFERRGRCAAVVIELPVVELDAAAPARRTTRTLPVQANHGAQRAA